MTAVVTDGQDGKEYRRPTEAEIQAAKDAEREVPRVFAGIPYALPTESTPKGGGGAARGKKDLTARGAGRASRRGG